MPRYRLLIEYDGRPFSGFQRQDGVPTVQAAIERAAAAFDPNPENLGVAGRTDAGVHATGQVVSIDLKKALTPLKLRDAFNAHLRPDPVAVIEAAEVRADWHARFLAVGRRYLYRISDRRAPPTFERGLIWRAPTTRLDVAAMADAAKVLIGTHDFSTFRDAECQAKSPVKTLDRLTVERVSDAEIHVNAASRSFLHRQVRSMVGSLAEVGRGRWTASDLKAALEAKRRDACGPVAPPDGLYLTGVVYDDSGAS